MCLIELPHKNSILPLETAVTLLPTGIIRMICFLFVCDHTNSEIWGPWWRTLRSTRPNKKTCGACLSVYGIMISKTQNHKSEVPLELNGYHHRVPSCLNVMCVRVCRRLENGLENGASPSRSNGGNKGTKDAMYQETAYVTQHESQLNYSSMNRDKV